MQCEQVVSLLVERFLRLGRLFNIPCLLSSISGVLLVFSVTDDFLTLLLYAMLFVLLVLVILLMLLPLHVAKNNIRVGLDLFLWFR